MTEETRYGWHKITLDSPPWDGTRVLVLDPKQEKVWLSSRLRSKGMKDGMPGSGHDWYCPDVGDYPTMWMPLPEG